MKRDSDANKGSAWEDCLRIWRMNISEKIRIHINQIITSYGRYLLVILEQMHYSPMKEQTK
jgi:hypothetical protein